MKSNTERSNGRTFTTQRSHCWNVLKSKCAMFTFPLLSSKWYWRCRPAFHMSCSDRNAAVCYLYWIFYFLWQIMLRTFSYCHFYICFLEILVHLSYLCFKILLLFLCSFLSFSVYVWMSPWLHNLFEYTFTNLKLF